MHSGEIAQWVMTIAVALGLIVTWVRNGRNQGAKWGSLETEMKTEMKNIKDKLDDENTGLGAIKKGVDDQKLHCAKISTELKTRVNALEGGKK